MTDTILASPAPAYVQINDQNRYGRDNYGISDKDRLHLDSDALNDALRDMTGVIMAGNAATQVAVEKTGAASILEVEKVGAAGQLANSLAFANTQNLLISGFKDALRDACQNTGAIQLLATQNAAAIQAAIAECCCEQKELTREEAGKTRDLINSVNASNLAIELADAKSKILALSLKVPTLAVC